MKAIELIAFYVIGLGGLVGLLRISKNIELIVQRLQWIHEDMKVKE